MKFVLWIALTTLPLSAQTAGTYSKSAWLYAANAADAAYDSGMRQLDQAHYEQAAQAFAKVRDGSKLDAALYWQAYSLNKLGRSQDALAALGKLRQDYPKSRWLSDAQVLEAEVRQGNGKASPEEQSNEELKLLALNGLLNADPDRAVMQIEHILKSNSSPKLKDRALFVLSQSRSPKARQLLVEAASGKGNPEMQSRAIRYIGMSGDAESRKQLMSIYNSGSEKDLKQEVIRSLMIGGAADQLLEIVKSEKDTHLRGEALRNLGMIRKVPASMYNQSNDPEWKTQVISALFMAGDGKGLVECARHETDREMKKKIVSQLSMMGNNKDAVDYMMEILK